ncbi:hypothetical protein [Aggregatibacter actinomycetemcomitans]|uniref:hypothetical protein n=1 Tax=Aggregatibacter actinomycetemcomitans TaxID=714 RepID=UPI00023FEF1A|nr:hypothetical protein [Aggregatibacter actinomycetemcomitans]EHK89846.1 hypothetical protein RHAA1_10931 [Aggregatibacter actinomycetemcomitans RhAA1]KNE76939.1 lipoprotein [Aggregatibacter actinomycetemcomitans RhAA1]
MAKYLVRLNCMVELPIEAQNMQMALDACDLNKANLSQMPHIITEVYDVIEIELVPSKVHDVFGVEEV